MPLLYHEAELLPDSDLKDPDPRATSFPSTSTATIAPTPQKVGVERVIEIPLFSPCIATMPHLLD
jgi:hypothetical protein